MKRKLLVLAMSFIMVFTMMPMMSGVYAADGGTVYINGEETNLATDSLPEGITLDSDGKTLILNNFEGTSIGTKSTEPLSIKLVGENKLTGDNSYYSNRISAMYVPYYGEINIDGEAGSSLTLDIQNDKSMIRGIDAQASTVNINGGNININVAYTGTEALSSGTYYGVFTSIINVKNNANLNVNVNPGFNNEMATYTVAIDGAINVSTSGNVSLVAKGNNNDGKYSRGVWSRLNMTGTGTVSVDSVGNASANIAFDPNNYIEYGSNNKSDFALVSTSATVTKVSDTNLTLVAPELGATPQTQIEGTDCFGYVEWTDGTNVPAVFGAETVYTATVTLVPKCGYTFEGVAENSLSVNNESASNDVNGNVVTYTFPATGTNPDTIVSEFDIQGVAAPVIDANPVNTITETDEYTGTVIWKKGSYDVTGNFGADTVYTAIITLTPKSGYTFVGVNKDAFTVNGATSTTNDKDSGVITAVFPATAKTIFVNGTRYILGTDQLPEGITLDSDGKTLILNNFEGTSIGTKSTEPLNIKLVGENKLTGDNSDYSNRISAMYVPYHGEINIDGEAGSSLTLDIQKDESMIRGIDAQASTVNINGGNININVAYTGTEALSSGTYYGVFTSIINVKNNANLNVNVNPGFNNEMATYTVAIYGDINVSTSGNVSLVAKGNNNDGKYSRGVWSTLNMTGTGTIMIDTNGQAVANEPNYSHSTYLVKGAFDSKKLTLTYHETCTNGVMVSTPATTTTNGVMAHYECSVEGCDKWYEDAGCTQLIEDHSGYTIPKVSDFKLQYTSYTYDGTAKEPAVTVKDANGTPLVKGTDYEVTYSNNKNIGTAKAIVTGKGSYQFTEELTFTIKVKNLASPAKLTTSLYGHDDVKVTWSKVTGATGYAVYYKRSTSKTYTLLGRTTGTSMKKANLTDGVKYTFKVHPYVKDGTGTRYQDTSYKYTTIYTLKKVSGVKAVRSGTKVKVSWSNISGESGYQISRSTKKTGTNIVKTYSTTSGKYYKVSATKGKTYYYKVRAYKTVSGKRIYAPWSTVVKYRR